MKRPINDPSAQASKRTGPWRDSPDKTTYSVNPHGTPTNVAGTNALSPKSTKSEMDLTPAQVTFLGLRMLPARLTAWQTATILGIAESNIPPLIGSGVLEPLVSGRGVTCRFALPYICSIREDEERLSIMTHFLIERSADKNRKP